MLTDSHEQLLCINQLWQYLRLEQHVQLADCLLVLGCHDLGVAHRACDLYQQGYAPCILFCGGKGKITQGLWQQSEAEMFAHIALQRGVPSSAILLEKHSTNTGENILYSMALLKAHGLIEPRILLVCKPYFERRAVATFLQHFADMAVQVTSQAVSLIDYLLSVDDLRQTIELLVGDVQRILLYPSKGWQIAQPVPDEIITAFEYLSKQGFDAHLL